MQRGNPFTQQRRWAVEHRRNAGPLMTERGTSGDEARIALYAATMQLGLTMVDLQGYDSQRDEYTVRAVDTAGKLLDVTVPGETIAQIALSARLHFGPNGKQLRRPSEVIKKSKA